MQITAASFARKEIAPVVREMDEQQKMIRPCSKSRSRLRSVVDVGAIEELETRE